MKENRVLVYPFTKESIPIIRFLQKSNVAYQITSIVSPSGYGLSNEDVGTVDNRAEMGYIVKDDVYSELENVDSVLITGGCVKDAVHYNTFEVINYSIEHNKDVLCCLTLENDIIKNFKQLAKKNNVIFDYFCEDTYINPKAQHNISKAPNTLDIPIILIGGLDVNMNVNEIFVNTVLTLKEKGINVCGISSQIYSHIYNIPHFPKNMFLNIYDLSTCILNLNFFLKTLANEKSPEVLVIEAPDAILRYSRKVPNGYGIKTYLVSQAVQLDYCICCIQSYTNINGLAESISNDIKVRLGVEIDYIHVSNFCYDYLGIQSSREIEGLYINYNDTKRQIEQARQSMSIPIYNLLDDTDFDRMIDKFIEKTS